MKLNEMGGICDLHGREEIAYRFYWDGLEERSPSKMVLK
jgi:hypothetical protein